MSGRTLTFCQRLFGKHNPRECWISWKSYSWVPKNGPIPALLEGYVNANKLKHAVNITPHPCSVCVPMISTATPRGWNHLAHNQGKQDAPPSFRESEFMDFFKTVSVLQCLAHCLLESMHSHFFELPCKSFGPYQLMLKFLPPFSLELWMSFAFEIIPVLREIWWKAKNYLEFEFQMQKTKKVELISLKMSCTTF